MHIRTHEPEILSGIRTPIGAPVGPIVVAIPARNEARRLGACLLALARQTHPLDTVVLLLNNCNDDSGDLAMHLAGQLPYRLETISVSLTEGFAHAGQARRLAMQRAAELAGPDGTLLTTDADSLVPVDWIERNVAALSAGADAVCGRIAVNQADMVALPIALIARDVLENAYRECLDKVAYALNPDPHDPWPRHTERSGASLAVSTHAYGRVGGMPAIACGEDRAFVDALERMDFKVRHDPDIEVVVSGRLDGRAAGGMADTMQRRLLRPDDHADAALEPAADAYRRADFRRRLREVWRRETPQWQRVDLAADLGVPLATLTNALSGPYFGDAWFQLQALSPVMPRRRLRYDDLPQHITLAKQFLKTIENAATRPSHIFRAGGW